MSIITIEHDIYVHYKSKNAIYFSNKHEGPQNASFFGKLIGYNKKTNNFIFDIFGSNLRNGIILKGEHELTCNLDYIEFNLNQGYFKFNLYGLLKFIKSIGAINKITGLPVYIYKKLHKEYLEENGMTFEKLVDMLKKVDSGEREVKFEPIKITDRDGNIIPHPTETYIVDEEISDLAFNIFIDINNRPIFDRINELREIGFDVYATERDGFGWLGAAIETKKGVIYFG